MGHLAQAHGLYVVDLIKELGLSSELVIIDMLDISDQGISIEELLNIALSNGDIDIAVQPLQYFTCEQSDHFAISSIGKRTPSQDVLVKKSLNRSVRENAFTIGANSERIKTQWKKKYRETAFEPIPDDLPAALEQLRDSDWDGIIADYSELSFLNRLTDNCVSLDWMIPTISQGILGVKYLKNNRFISKMMCHLQDAETEQCMRIERRFLELLRDRTAMPVAANAKIQGDILTFKACICSASDVQILSNQCKKSMATTEVEKWVNEFLATQEASLSRNIHGNRNN